jgi:oligosaccharide repeat unit polymerase
MFVRNKADKSGNLLIFTVFLVYCFFIAIFLGERDVLLSYILVFLIFYNTTYGMSLKAVIFCIVALMISIPILGSLKNIFTSSKGIDLNVSDIAINLLNGEFRSAGFNINVLLSSSFELKYGASLIYDLLRSLIPAFIYEFENSVSWYNNTYHPGIVAQGRGYGFSLAAEGFINFSYFGVFLWFFIVGLLIRALYRGAVNNEVIRIIYCLSVPFFIYSLRGDLSSIFSPLLKQILIPYVILWCFDRFLKVVSQRRTLRDF